MTLEMPPDALSFPPRDIGDLDSSSSRPAQPASAALFKFAIISGRFTFP
jgi:hypothetical protein